MQKMIEERTYWNAVYSNGKSLPQFNEDGTENKYRDIDRTRLIRFDLYRNNTPIVVIHLDAHKKLIYRMRRAQNNHGYEETVYLAGWQEKHAGQNVQMIIFLFDDNHIEILDRFYEDHSWFYSIRFLKEEKI